MARFFAGLLIALIVALALGWAAGLVWFLRDVPNHVGDNETRTDAIVVLTGGHGRIEEGVVLLRLGLAKKLFVSGVEPGVEVGELLKRAHVAPGPVADPIVLGHDATSTAANADETASWMRGEDFHSLRLVTANYHMRRSLLEFRHAMPEVTVIPNPVFPEAGRPANWFAWPANIHVIALEYTKYLVAALTLSLEPDGPAT